MYRQNGAAKKNYTTLDLSHCFNKATGKEFDKISVIGLAKNPVQSVKNMKDGSTKNTVSFEIPILNLNQMISDFFGIAPSEDKNGTIWARCTAWDKTADRLDKLLQKINPAGAVLLVYATAKVTQNGQYQNLDCSVYNFELIRTVGNSGEVGTKEVDDTIPTPEEVAEVVESETELPF